MAWSARIKSSLHFLLLDWQTMTERVLPGQVAGGLRALSTVLDRLERAGYIRRQPDPTDRRRQVVQITEYTAARDREVFDGLIRQTGDLLATYTDDQLAVIRDFLDRTRQLTAAYADTLNRPAGTSGAQEAAHGTR